MRAPRYWKKLKRHPIGSAYQDLEGDSWKQFVKDVKDRGIINSRKITLFEGMVLDGWQLHRACVELGLKPAYQNLPKNITAEAFVQIVNDNRRHETPEEAVRRIEARKERVAAAREDGKSLRSIAKEEGISEKQVRRDLGKEDDAKGKKPELVHAVSGDSFGAREPGDDSESIRGEKKGPTKASYSFRDFDAAFGKLMREIDVLGKTFGVQNTPVAAGLRRKLDEWRTELKAWHKKLMR